MLQSVPQHAPLFVTGYSNRDYKLFFDPGFREVIGAKGSQADVLNIACKGGVAVPLADHQLQAIIMEICL